MPTSTPVVSFDYSTLKTETARFVQIKTGEIKTLLRRTAQDLVEIGSRLIEIKDRLEHGQFLNWLEAEFPWGERTAQDFMNVAKHFKNANFADLRLAASAIRFLASPSVPEAARQEALALAQAGEEINLKRVKEIKQKYLQKARNTDEEEKILEGAVTVIATVEEKPENQSGRVAIPVSQHFRETTLTVIPSTPRWWRLNDTHRIFCGRWNSEEFIAQLPSQIDLWLSFPPQMNQWDAPPNKQVKNAFSFFTVYQDIDIKGVCEAVEKILEVATEADNSVVFSFLPDPLLLILADKLQCQCFVAEPEEARCQVILSAWEQIGGKVAVEN